MYIKSQSEVDNSLYLTTRNFRKCIETLEKGEEGGGTGGVRMAHQSAF